MAVLNKGSQKIRAWDYKNEATGDAFNEAHRGLFKPGIYSGGECSVVGNEIRIQPFRAVFQDGTEKVIHIDTSATIDETHSYPNDILYMTYTYDEVIENWIDFSWRASTDAPVTNEIILCKVNYAGSTPSNADNTYKTYGFFDEDFNARIDGTLIVTDDPTSDTMVGNRGYNDDRYMSNEYYSRKLEGFQYRLESAESKLLHNTIELSYLMQRRSNYSDWMIETYYDDSYSGEDWEDLSNNAILMDDTEWNNNWKQIENPSDTGMTFKNGFIRPDTQKYMLEEIERFDLTPLGTDSYVHCISRYDPINECYWVIANNDVYHDATTDYGIIFKIGKELKDGQIDVQGKWYLSTLYLVYTAQSRCVYSGIDVTSSTIYNTARDEDEQFLFITFTTKDTTQSAVGLGKLIINSDGTLGKNHTPQNSIITWQETWTSAGDYHVCDKLTRLEDGNYYPDCTVWGNHIAVLKTENNAGAPLMSIEFHEMEDNDSGAFITSDPRSDIVGLESIIGSSHANSELSSYSLIKNNNELWIKVNEYNADFRFIYKFDVSEDVPSSSGKYAQDVDEFTGDIVGYIDSSSDDPKVIKASGRFNVAVGVDPRSEYFTDEGISISHDEHILEITSTNVSPYPKVLHKRALSGALWVENQINGEISPKSYDSTNVPNTPRACMVESNRYYWTGDFGVTANQVDVFRYDTQTGDLKHCRLTGSSWTAIIDMTTDGTNIWLLGFDGTNYEVYFDTLSNITTAMGSSYNIANTYDVTTGTLASGIGAANTNVLYGIAYDNDDDILYLLNDTDDKIDTLSTDGTTWTQGVIDLPAPTAFWVGIAYNNNKIYIGDYTNSTTVPNTIVSLNKTLSTDLAWYREHIYQDPSTAIVAAGRTCIDFDDDNNLLCMNITQLKFFKMKVLDDPDVLQLHVFLDSNNILLSDYIYCQTPIVERYFEPEDFTEYLPVDSNGILDMSGSEDHYEYLPSRRNVPDIKYMALGYGDEGMSVLHLDTFLSGKSSAGKDRRYVTDIRYWHFEKSTSANTPLVDGNIVHNVGPIGTIFIEKDMIFFGDNSGINDTEFVIIDLKNGKATMLGNAAWYSSQTYDGTLSQRNENLGYSGQNNLELALAGGAIRKIHARTFTKDDESDYTGKNPKTCVAIGNDGGCDVMMIDWDDNGNRTINRVYNDVFNSVYLGQHANWIAPSGTLFGGDWVAAGGLVYGNKPVWELNKNAGFNHLDDNPNVAGESLPATFITDKLISHVTDFSPNSRCWKMPDGTWRHQLIFSTLDSTDLNVLAICDVENLIVEKLYDRDQTSGMTGSCDTYENLVFSVNNSYSGYLYGMHILNKTTFPNYIWGQLGTLSGQYYNGWYPRFGYIIRENTRPYMLPPARDAAIASDYGHTIRYSKDFGILTLPTKIGGLQFFLLNNYKNNCVHESIEKDTDNPSYYYYLQSIITNDDYDVYE